MDKAQAKRLKHRLNKMDNALKAGDRNLLLRMGQRDSAHSGTKRKGLTQRAKEKRKDFVKRDLADMERHNRMVEDLKATAKYASDLLRK